MLVQVAAIALLAHCGDDDGGSMPTDGGVDGGGGPQPTLTAVAVSPDPVQVDVGANQRLTVTGTFSDGTTRALTTGVTFTSEDDAVALVSSNGTVTGVAAGATTVTATVEALSDTVDVTVGGGGERPLLVVDEVFDGRGGFGEGGPNGHVEDSQDGACPTRPAGALGACHEIRWNGAISFTGAVWLSGTGFGDAAPRTVAAPGDGEIRVLKFYAWGADGGEVLEAGAGDTNLGDVAQARQVFNLTTTPQQFEVPLPALNASTDIYAGFVFALTSAANPGSTEIYIDDIRWETAPDPALSLPFTVDEEFTGRGGFGEGGPPGHVEDAAPGACPTRPTGAVGACHQIEWNGAITFTGAIWLNGTGFDDRTPRPVAPPGAGESRVLRFYAWGAEGGEVLEAGAGDVGLGDAANIRQNFTLTTTPVLYELSLAPLDGSTSITAAFVFAMNNAANPGGAEIYIDGIEWDSVVPARALRPDPADVVIGWNGGTPALGAADIGGANVGDAEGASSYVIPFVLPPIPPGGFTQANLRVNVIATAGAGTLVDLHGDLYGLPFRTAAAVGGSSVVTTSMFHASATVDASATLLVDNFLTGSTPGGESDLDTNAAGDAALLAYLNAQVTAGAVAGDYVYLRLSPDAAPPIGGGYTWVVSAAVNADAPPNRPTLTVR